MKKNMKLISGLTGAACLLSSMAVAEEAAAVTVSERAEETFAKVANVQGEFAFAQDTLTPPDEVFNLFGTAATYACAKPGFALNPSTREEHYINVGGKVKKNFTISAEQLAKMESQKRDLVCTCAMSPSAAMASVRGVRVADLLAMADVEADANTITMKDAQGYGLAMPLSYVLEKDALLVYEIGDLPLETADGTQVQVWMPDTVAKYFTRQITEIELTAEAEVPAVEGVNPEYRAKVSVLNRFDNTFAVGDQINIEGYADDCGKAIKAIEFSMDGGETFTTCETAGATGDAWVYWHFGYTAEAAGTYKLDVRAVAEDGTVSPLASSVVFTVE